MVRINIPFRLHITLIAMHQCSYRKNGGIGLSVNTGCLLTVIPDTKTSIKVNGDCNDFEKLSDIESLLRSIVTQKNFTKKPKINIEGDLYFHSGLGVGTAITLACIEAVFLINDTIYNIEDIKSHSRRGGTSGIGVNSYFTGGFLLDLGHASDQSPHNPSRYADNNSLPISLKTVPFFFENLYFILPTNAPLICGKNEQEFFQTNTPIDAKKAYETCYLSIFGVLASVVEQNLHQFDKSITSIQKTNWKSLEIERAGDTVKNLMSNLKDLKCKSIGMSSLGNGIYFILNSDSDFNKVNDLAKESNCKLLSLTPSNNGRVIEIV